MAVLPSGLVVPPLPYVAALVVTGATVAAFLVSVRPRCDQLLVAALTPWMALGAVAHAFHQVESSIDIYPAVLEPLFGAPAVYLTTFVAMGVCWSAVVFVGTLGGGTGENGPKYLGIAGGGLLAAFLIYAGYVGAFADASPFWPTVALLATIPASAVIYFMMTYWATAVVARARLVGGLVVFAHLLDGVTTAVGVDMLPDDELDVVSAAELADLERSPIPRIIMEFAGDLPTATFMGVGWLFVVVKLFVAIGIVVLFADYLEAEPLRANLLFAVVIVFGFGPAVNNLVLFTLQGATAAG